MRSPHGRLPSTGLQRWSEAVTAYDTMFAFQPNLPVPYCNQGYAYMQLNNSASAIVSYKKCTSLDTTNLMEWNNLGLAYMATGEYPECHLRVRHGDCDHHLQCHVMEQQGKGLCCAGQV